MKTLGIFEFKNRVSEIAAEVERGETVIITRNGRPIGQFGPIRANDVSVRQVLSELQAMNLSLGGIDPKELIDEGRRI